MCKPKIEKSGKTFRALQRPYCLAKQKPVQAPECPEKTNTFRVLESRLFLRHEVRPVVWGSRVYGVRLLSPLAWLVSGLRPKAFTLLQGFQNWGSFGSVRAEGLDFGWLLLPALSLHLRGNAIPSRHLLLPRTLSIPGS